MSKSPAEILRAARKLIERPQSWTQEVYARKADGEECGWDSPQACRRCMEGAIFVAYDHAERFTQMEVLKVTSDACDGNDIAQWNDAPDRTHAEVLVAFDHAIALAEAEERS